MEECPTEGQCSLRPRIPKGDNRSLRRVGNSGLVGTGTETADAERSSRQVRARCSEMTDIPPINGTGRLPGTLPVERLRSAREGPFGAAPPPVDRVEISDAAQALSALDPDSGVRAEKVAEIREAIANGTYLTDEKVSITADRLLDALRASLTG